MNSPHRIDEKEIELQLHLLKINLVNYRQFFSHKMKGENGTSGDSRNNGQQHSRGTLREKIKGNAKLASWCKFSRNAADKGGMMMMMIQRK